MHPPLAVDGGEARWILLISATTIMVAHLKAVAILVGLCGAKVGGLEEALPNVVGGPMCGCPSRGKATRVIEAGIIDAL